MQVPAGGLLNIGLAGTGETMGKLLLIILCFFFPFLAVLIKYGPCMKVVWAILLQLIGHLPGVIYGIYQVTRNNEPTYY
jgi:uncharacterized membrane protein YqaE (UPF0057 family)